MLCDFRHYCQADNRQLCLYVGPRPAPEPDLLIQSLREHHEPSMSTAQCSIFALTCASHESSSQRQPHHQCWRLESGCYPWASSSPQPPRAFVQLPSPVDFVSSFQVPSSLTQVTVTAHFGISQLLACASSSLPHAARSTRLCMT